MAYQEKSIGNGHVAIHDWDPVDERGHHKNSSVIQHDIDETRSTMDSLLDALSGRFQPHSLVDRFLGYFQQSKNQEKVKDSLMTVGKRIGDSFSRNPLPAIMIGAGSVWMLWETQRRGTGVPYREHREEESTGGKEDLESKTREFQGKAEDTFAKVKEKVGSGINKIQGERQNMMDRSDEIKNRMQERYQHGVESADRMVHDNPLAIGFASLAIGIVAGLLLPETREERRTLGPKSREAMDTMREKGEELVSQGKEIATDFKESVKSEAERQEITPEQLKNKAERAGSEQGAIGERAEKEHLTPEELGMKAGDVTRVALNETEEKFRDKRNPGK